MSIWLWIVVLQVKHFVADYPLQGSYMLGKFKREGWILPLAAHAGVQAAFTLVIAACIDMRMWWVCLVDFVTHFTMDRIKASPNLLGRFKTLNALNYILATKSERWGNTLFWWALGFDQLVHHLSDILILWMLLR